MVDCEICGKKSVVKVAEQGGMDMFSCINEDCPDYAELLVETNGGLERVHDMLQAYQEMVKEITDEKNKVHRS